MKVLSGVSLVPGIVIGKAFLYLDDDREIPHYTIGPDQVRGELERFVAAAREAAEELRGLEKNGGPGEQGAIFRAHLMMVEDPDFHYQIKARLESKYENIEWIVFEVARDLSQKLMQSPSAYLRERASDVADVSRRLVLGLQGINPFSLVELGEDVILAARSLLPSDVLTMNKARVKALVMDSGSRTSHTAILLRSFGIPSVLGLSTAVREISSGDRIIVDGGAGQVILDPGPEILKDYKERLAQVSSPRRVSVLKDRNAETTDGRRVILKANIGVPEEAEELARYGAEGIGLYRSEFLFLRTGQGAEEQQLEAYRRVIRAMKGKPVTIRTVDLGGDKILPVMQPADEENPLLGWRAIRYSLAYPEVFKTQLRAILRSSADGNVGIMFPMISGIEELEQALAVWEEAKAECLKRKQPYAGHIETGCMIEIPSAAMTADVLAKKSDFFSIGTNDLIQYTLAVDRGNEKVTYLAQPFHPAVLRFLKKIIDTAHAGGIKAAMCGELAGDPSATALLLGFGLDEFSMTASSIPLVKRIIRGVSLESCRILAEKALQCLSYQTVNSLVEGWMEEHFPGD
jgi:phosphotransferase system enzyme I (PtsI)